MSLSTRRTNVFHHDFVPEPCWWQAYRPASGDPRPCRAVRLPRPPEEAKEWIAKLLAVNPVHTVAWFRNFSGKFLSPGTLAVWIEGLRHAGLREE